MLRSAAVHCVSRNTRGHVVTTITDATTRFHPPRVTIQRSLSSAAEAVSFPPDTTVLLCSNIPVEPSSSAAGVRTAYLLERLVESPGTTSVHFVTPRLPQAEGYSKDGDDDEATAAWKQRGVQLHELPPNRNDQARDFLLHKLPKPSEHLLVIFDRFYTEEMFSFHVHKHCPQAVLVLDMQDLHALRGHRQNWVKKQDKAAADLSNLPISTTPGIDDPKLLRELTSIQRSDLTLVCSHTELDFLSQKYQIPDNKLCLAPLFGDLPTLEEWHGFRQRSDFVFVGGFRHDPNVDAVWQLKRLWPLIRQAVDNGKAKNDDSVRVHVYGAYCSDHLRRELHDPASGFLMHGFDPSPVDALLADKRVMLSPIRFGAGIKGKHVDAWKNGLPVVTTPIGSEGMMGKSHDDLWGGIVARSDDEFVQAASVLYNNVTKWNKSVSATPGLLSRLCGHDVWNHVATRLVDVLEKRQKRRKSDYIRSILWQESIRSTEYFSKFIEWREKKKEKV